MRTGRAIPLLLLVACRPAAPVSLELYGESMGTSWSVELVEPAPGLTRARLAALSAQALGGVDERMSTWRDDSELVRFNRQRGTDWFPVSRQTAEVVEEALAVAELSGGAFDPTVAPLVELWGFAGTGSSRLPPSPTEIARARARVGHRELEVRADDPALRKRRPDLAVDLSGIAKGYAVDQLCEQLLAAGARRFLVEVGGELRASGSNRRGQPWQVAVEQPVPWARRVQRVVALRDEAIATSGSYRNFAQRDGRRFGHILDPETGAPPEGELVSVSVVAATAMRADALATALFALGAERGPALAEREELAALFLLAGAEGLRERPTAGWDARRPPAVGSGGGSMPVFGLTLLALSLCAAALSIGAFRGRPLPGGSCREAWLTAHGLPRCRACPARGEQRVGRTGSG